MEKPIRILHVIGIMNRGGAEAMIMNLYRSIDKEKIQFDFVQNCTGPAIFDEEIRQMGGKIYHCPHYNGKNHFQYVKWWKKFFKNHKDEYYIVHGHLGSTAAIYLHIANKFGLYTIAHSHCAVVVNSYMERLYTIFSYPTRYIADFFFGCSLNAGISRYGKKIVSKNNFKVLNNAIDLNQFAYNKQIREKIRNELKVTNEFVIGHVGRMDNKQKNQAFLLNLIKQMKNQYPVKLVLVGTGVNYDKLVKQAEEMGLENDVLFLGVRSDVNELLQGMDCFVFPSFYEGLPVTLIETQAASLPSVISDTITDEVILTDIVTKVSLNSSLQDWIVEIIKYFNYDRSHSYINDLNAYDVKFTSKWMEDFYIKCQKENLKNH
ncbi:glycosyltransferase family 1 protein [Thomasclavelia cocleata]|uniref:Glycosyltransferase involved in cell wall bisynthesis n=1 Tax=Thomasclavelia cocleata TaxID=69824 RepID=A0A1I0CWT8_9FIRM|nr:glycosyltransferase [Thomasclavelia cocleata]MCR1959802.1 glycosyltransferase [Thomasclavelia cocleata]NDO41010.1 glycosyltransferase family 1 protein [Thomasclavelia cocleata]PJN81541.1 glycosyltransferase family 1 protein [Thomasclavelia cocleata]SET23788.1 Glycosyltransferase involved in cell wall bisynthesis [Thomasclavelia cocleata]